MKPEFCLNERAFEQARQPNETAADAFGSIVSLIEEVSEVSEQPILVSSLVYLVVVDGVGTQLASMLFELPDERERDFLLRMSIALARCSQIDPDEMPGDGTTDVDQAGVLSKVASDAISIAVHFSLDRDRYFGVLSRGENGLRAGIARLTSEADTVNASIVISRHDIPKVYRAAIPVLATDEDGFFELAVAAYPDLVFSPTLTFSRLTGGYLGNVTVVCNHLQFLNDDFLNIAKDSEWDLPQMMAKSAVAFSDESSETKKQDKLMKQRDIQLKDIEQKDMTVRCSLHTKLYPMRGRIHFHPPVQRIAPKRIIVGIFHDHLDT